MVVSTNTSYLTTIHYLVYSSSISLPVCLYFQFRFYNNSMRSFFRILFRRRPSKPASDSPVSATSRAMSTGAVSAILYACTFSKPSSLGAVPEDSEAKAHHLKGGKGFSNPWKSWRDMNMPQIMGTMAWYVQEPNVQVPF